MSLYRESGYQEIRKQDTRVSDYQGKREEIFYLMPGYPDVCYLIS